MHEHCTTMPSRDPSAPHSGCTPAAPPSDRVSSSDQSSSGSNLTSKNMPRQTAWDHPNWNKAFFQSEEWRQQCEKSARDRKRRCEITANAIYPLAGMDTVRRAVQVYNPREKQPPEHKVWDDLVDIFQLHDIPWMDKQHKKSACATKLYRSMSEILHQLGCEEVRGAGKVWRAFVPPGQPLPELPEWLQLPWLEVSHGPAPPLYIPEYSVETMVGIGHPVEGAAGVGSLGPPVVVIQDDATQCYGFLTAGHVVDDGASRMTIPDPECPSRNITAHVPRPFRRALNRPFFRVAIGMADTRLDEAMVLLIRGDDHLSFDFHMPGCNLVAFNRNHYDELDRVIPLEKKRRTAIEDILTHIGPLPVYKRGITTGRTAGLLTRIRNQLQLGPDEDDDDLLDGQDIRQWIGVVEWDNSVFAEAGDSGAFVWTTQGDEVVPLGIHLGSSPSSPVSLFASVDAFALELHRAGYFMSFL